MADARKMEQPEHLHAIVDMGSNGIRFSISDLQPPTARIMPTIYQHRVGISLYDAQFSGSGERVPITNETIDAVLTAFKQFQGTCADFHVPENNITVLATEATRTATNSEDFQRQIKATVGWEVMMLPKEEEGRVGALGIASSLPDVRGLVMDLGGGSTQLSWIMRNDTGSIRMPDSGAVSMPYGAAAMARRLAEAEKSNSIQDLRHEVQRALKDAFAKINTPNELQDTARVQGGYALYLSGGGFRGWGYVLMSKHRVQPYPIPVINGFKVSRPVFLGTEEVKQAAAISLETKNDEIFRVSDRRASQVPAVAFLINALAEAIPEIQEVRFCQGGVREGYLFRSLAAEVQAQHPLVVATQLLARNASDRVLEMIKSAFPSGSTLGAQDDYKSVFNHQLLESFVNSMYFHASHSKDLQASSALRSTTSGVLAGVHGILHEDRALLALMLCARWSADVPPADDPFKENLERLVESPWTLWWVNYVGAVAALVAAVYPAGVEERNDGRLLLQAKWDVDEKQKPVLSLDVRMVSEVHQAMFAKELKNVEQAGKKKRWIGGKEGCGHKVVMEVGALSA